MNYRYRHLGYVRNSMPDDLPRLDSYAKALQWHDQIKPFAKGHNQGLKPLGRNRKYGRLQIRKCETTGNILVKHYNTDIVTYCPDGRLHFTTGDQYPDSISTCQVLQELFGPTYFARKRGKVYFNGGNEKFFRIRYGLEVDQFRNVVSETATREKYHKLNRTKFKAAKAQFATFLEYAVAVTNMTGGGAMQEDNISGVVREITDDSYGRTGQWAIRTDAWATRWFRSAQGKLRPLVLNKILEAQSIADSEARYEALLPLVNYISFCASKDYNVKAVSRGDDIDRIYVWATDKKQFAKFFEEVLKYEYDVFDLEEGEYGEVRHDPNKKYIKTK